MNAYADIKPEIDKTTQATQGKPPPIDQLAGSFTVVTKSAEAWRVQALQLLADAERTAKTTGTTTTGWLFQHEQNLRAEAGRALESANRQERLDAQVAGMGAPWGRQGGGWTINVNAQQGIDGDAIASELVSGMRRRGISPGGF